MILQENIHTVLEAVMTEEQCNLHKILKEISVLKEQIKTIDIKKESAVLSEKVETPKVSETLSVEDLKSKVSERFSVMQEILVMQQSIATASQVALLSAQVQGAFFRTFKKIKKGDPAENHPHFRDTVKNYETSLECSIEIAELEEEQKGLFQDITQLKKKYSDGLSTMENQWKIINGEHVPNSVKSSDEYAKLDKQLQERNTRISVLKALIRALISGSSTMWGSNPRYLETLCLCDAHDFGLENLNQNFTSLSKTRMNANSTSNGS